MEQDVWHYIVTHGLLEERHAVGAAVSGGADSMALLICLRALSREHGFTVTALHFDHGTRSGASARDAQFVREFCMSRGIPLICGHADVPALARENGIGLELAGRRAREEFFSEAVAKGQVDVVATAHHMDDNAESVLMHMLRGCGLDGLIGIRRSRGILIRPFLGITRHRIEQYLKDAGVPWITDESNEDTAYDRNFIRHEVLSPVREHLNPSASAAVRRLSECAEEDADCLAQLAQLAFDRCAAMDGESCRIDAAALVAEHPAIAQRVLRLALARIGRSSDVEKVHTDAVLAAARAGRTGKTVEIGDGVRARTEYGTLVIEKQSDTTGEFSFPLRLPGVTHLDDGSTVTCEYVKARGPDTEGSRCEYVDADRLPENAVIRTRQPGDVLRPLNAPGHRKLKEYFIDRKIPRPRRDTIPLLAAGSTILWVIGSGLSDDLRVTETTTRICRLSYEPA